MIIPPAKPARKTELIRGPNIKPLPKGKPLEDKLACKVLLKLGDNISTDDILPGGSKVLPLRSNIPAISRYVFARIDPTFADRALESAEGCIVGENNYGQGSSREHAALAPMYLGIRTVLARSFARIHRSNLINFGIIPLVVVEGGEMPQKGDTVELAGLKAAIRGGNSIEATINGKRKLPLKVELAERERAILLAGGLLRYIRRNLGKKA